MLWAWERPEDLRFIDPSTTGVAFLSGTVSIRREGFDVLPRMQALKVPPGTVLESVVRIEADSREIAHFPETLRREIVTAILKLGVKPGIGSLQIDFDATRSQRDFYRALLRDLCAQMPPAVSLSMTALASWALHDNWLDGLPVDNAVPMLFRMGADRHEVRLHLQAGGDFLARSCRQSLCISTDEPVERLPRRRRVYVFHPRPWSREVYDQTVRELTKWQ
jgi:hypothetical protein